MKAFWKYYKEHWTAYTSLVSWVTRPYHWIKKDEDIWESIDRNIDAIAGNVILASIVVVAIVILAILELTK